MKQRLSDNKILKINAENIAGGAVNKINKFLEIISIFYVLFFCLSLGLSEASEFSFMDGGFFYKGFRIDTSLDICPEKFRIEGGYIVRAISNEKNDYETIKIVSDNGELEIWLFNDGFENKFIKIGSYPTDFRVDWVSKDYLRVSREHMGASVDYLYKIDLNVESFKESGPIDKLIYFDPGLERYVKFLFDDSVVGKDKIIIVDIGSGLHEEVYVDINYMYRSDALDMIDSVYFCGNDICLDLKEDGSIVNYRYELD
jgi:hypothetical protein